MAKKNSKLQGLLKKAQGKWKKTPAASGGFANDNVEDGSYDAVLTGAELKELGGKAAVVLEYTIADGEDCEGEKISARYFLESDQNKAYLKRDLNKFVDEDTDLDELDLAEELEDLLSSIVEGEPSCRITVRTKDEFQNVYLNKVDVDGSGGGDDDDDDDDDDGGSKKGRGKKGKKGSASKGKKKSDDDDDDSDDDDDDDDDDDSDDDDAPEISKGDTVLFTPPRAKKAKEFEVVSVKAGKATLKDEDGNKLSGILVSKLELVDDENDSENDDDDDDSDDDAPKGKKGKKGKKKSDDDDDDSDDDDDDDDDSEDVEIEVGSKVTVNFKGKECAGKITELDEDNEKVQVKFKHGKETVEKWFKADKVEAA